MTIGWVVFLVAVALVCVYWPCSAGGLSRGASTMSAADLSRGASTMSAADLSVARAAHTQPILSRVGLLPPRLDLALDALVFDGLVVAGDSEHVSRLTPGQRAAVALQIAADAELAFALSRTERDFAAFADLGRRAGRHGLALEAAGPAARAATARVDLLADTARGLAADAAEARAASSRSQLAGAGRAAVADAILAGGLRHAADSQNVHDPAVVDSTNATLRLLSDWHGRPTPAAVERALTWGSQVVHDTYGHPGSPDFSPTRAIAAAQGLRLATGPGTYAGVTMGDVLALVHARADDPRNSLRAGLLAENTAKALADASSVCITGRITSLLGALAVNDEPLAAAGGAQPETLLQLRNDALNAARLAGLAHARALSSEGGPLSAAASNFLDPSSSPDPHPDLCAALTNSLAATAEAAAVDSTLDSAGVSRLRPDALAELVRDVRAAY